MSGVDIVEVNKENVGPLAGGKAFPQTPTTKTDLAALRSRIKQQLQSSSKRDTSASTVLATPKPASSSNNTTGNNKMLLHTPVGQRSFEVAPPSTRGKRRTPEDDSWDASFPVEGDKRLEIVSRLKGEEETNPKTWIALVQHDWQYMAGGNDKDLVRRVFKRLLKVFEEAVKAVPARSADRNSEPLVELWILYARIQTKVSADDARNTFQYMKTNKIGDLDARFYVSWAKFEADTGDVERAQQILAKGEKSRAQPAHLLEEGKSMLKRGCLKTPARTSAASRAARPPLSTVKKTRSSVPALDRRDSDEIVIKSALAATPVRHQQQDEETVQLSMKTKNGNGAVEDDVVIVNKKNVVEDDVVTFNPSWKAQEDESTVSVQFRPKSKAMALSPEDEVKFGGKSRSNTTTNKNNNNNTSSVVDDEEVVIAGGETSHMEHDQDIVFAAACTARGATVEDENTIAFKVAGKQEQSHSSSPGSDVVIISSHQSKPSSQANDDDDASSSASEVVINKNNNHDRQGKQVHTVQDDEVSIPTQEATVAFTTFKNSKLDDDEVTLLMKLQDENDPTLILKRQVGVGSKKSGSSSNSSNNNNNTSASVGSKPPMATASAATTAPIPLARSRSALRSTSGSGALERGLAGKGKGKGKGKSRGLRSLRTTKFGKLSGGPARRVGADEAEKQLKEEEPATAASSKNAATTSDDAQLMPPPPSRAPTVAKKPAATSTVKPHLPSSIDDIEAEVNQLIAETGGVVAPKPKLHPAPVPVAVAPVSNPPTMTTTTTTTVTAQNGTSNNAYTQQQQNGSGGNKKENIEYVNGVPYEKLEVVGRGGTSKVYKVMGPDRKIYAMKRIRLDGADESEIESYYNEIALLKRLSNVEQIIRLKDSQVNLEDKVIFMVMPFGDIDLAKLLHREKGKGIDENFLRLYWQQMLEAVHAIHEERIIHADLKPANFLFVEGKLKLIDFGIAKAISNDTTNIRREDNEIIGTTSYMSPEAILDTSAVQPGTGKKLGRSSDIWSLGCILYQMVYGRTPFSHLSVIKRLQLIPNPKYEIQFPEVSNKYLMDVMKRCLRRNPEERPTIPELLAHAFVRPQDVVNEPSGAPVVSKEQLASLLTQLSNLNDGQVSKEEMAEQLFRQLQSGGELTLNSSSTKSSSNSNSSTSASSSSSSSSSSSRSGNGKSKTASRPAVAAASTGKSKTVDLSSETFEQAIAAQQKKLQPVATSSNARFVKPKDHSKAPTGVAHLGQVLQQQLNAKFTQAGQHLEDNEDSGEWTIH